MRVGNSSLAREMATQLHQEFGHDVVDVPLESVSEPGLAWQSLRSHVPYDCIRPTIVAARIGELLALCPSLHIIATSRVAMRIGGEIGFALEQLQVPPPATEACVYITKVESVVMLSRAVRRFDHDFTIAAICRRVEGPPLAISSLPHVSGC